jgi:colanic acid/amylovoran biosynthesis protein
MNKINKVLIINAYSYKNRGDSGIIVAMIDIIRKSYKNADISVMSQYHEQNIEYYNKMNVKSVPPVWDIINTKGFLNKYIDGIKKLFYNNQNIEQIQTSDIILSAGGGYLYSSRKGPLGVGFINALYHIWLATKLKKKIILFPQSVGPLNYFLDRFILKKVFNRVDYFYSREHITTHLLKNSKVKMEQLPDVAFSLEPSATSFIDEKINTSQDVLKIGITVLDWRFAHKNSTLEDIDMYLFKIANALNTFKTETSKKIKVYIFPQVTVDKKDGDVIPSKILLDKIKYDVEIFYLDKIEDPKELIYLYSKMDLFIGSRMHSAIFSLVGNVPSIALAYQPKTTGTFDLVNLNDFVLDIKSFTEEELRDKIHQLLILKTKSKETIKIEIDSIRNKIIKSIFHRITE